MSFLFNQHGNEHIQTKMDFDDTVRTYSSNMVCQFHKSHLIS